MSERVRETMASGLTNGRLEGISVPDLLWGLCQQGRTGVLHVTSSGITRSVYIDEGAIIFGASSDPDDRLGDRLVRADVVTLDQLERAASRLGDGKRLGTLLVEGAAITPQDLVDGVLSQVKEIILSLFPVEEGEYRFEEGPLPTEEVITLGMKTGEILLEGIRQVRSFTRIRRSVGPPRTRFRLVEDWPENVEGLALSEGERSLLRVIGDHGMTAEDLCREVFLSNFEIYQALWAFKVLGAIEETDQAVEAATDAAFEGRLDSEGIAPALVRLCREGLTGVLYVSRGTIDRTFHITEGRCVFATSSSIDDGLVSHLLRRGVISLRDREETARRLLSNKRVGTILREIGVIDQRDLREMVREQLSEIVFDTFSWTSGDYAFVIGELPTVEEITLERSLEDLVLAGVRRIDSWARVRKGCGGLDATLVLTPEYLDVLDRSNVGEDEWEVVAALRDPGSVRQICQASRLGDFRVCQILWALQLLGAATQVPVDAVVEAIETAAPRVVLEPPLALGPGDETEPAIAHDEPERETEPVAVEEDRPQSERVEPEIVPSMEPWTVTAGVHITPEVASGLESTGAADGGSDVSTPGQDPAEEAVRAGAPADEEPWDLSAETVFLDEIAEPLESPESRIEVSGPEAPVESPSEPEWTSTPGVPSREEVLPDAATWTGEPAEATTEAVPAEQGVSSPGGLEPAVEDQQTPPAREEGFENVWGEMEPEAVSAETGTGESPRLDSPVDATRFIPRDEVELDLGQIVEEDQPAFELAEPGVDETEPMEPEADREPDGAGPEFEVDSIEAKSVAEPVAGGPTAPAEGTEPGSEPGVDDTWDMADPSAIVQTTQLSREDVEAALEAERSAREWKEPAGAATPEPVGWGTETIAEPEEETEEAVPEPVEAAETRLSHPESPEDTGSGTSEAPAAEAVEETGAGPVEAVGPEGVEETESAPVEVAAPEPAEEAGPELAEVSGPEGVEETESAPVEVAAPEPAEEAGPELAEGWTPPSGLQQQITRFNAMQRMLYQSIKSEVGAGAANFVRACGGGLPTGSGDLFSRVELRPDGAWDPAGMREAIVERRLDDPWPALQNMLDEELERLKLHVGDDRAASIRERIESLAAESASPGYTALPPE